MTDQGIQPVELAQWVENKGFESLWFGEHTHSPDPQRINPDRDPEGFDQLYDPYVTLAVAAAVTRTLKLGFAVSLLPQHHPISIAKMIATLDHISNGRIQFGIGAGSRPDEVEDFGFAFKDRWKVTREFVKAIRTIWTNDVAQFEGRYFKFGPMRSWPKPVQPEGPPILEGAFSKWTARRIAEYADGWIAYDGVPTAQTFSILKEIKAEWSGAGRKVDALDLTMIMRIPVGAEDAHDRIDEMRGAGFQRLVFLMRPDEAAQWEDLEWFADLMKAHG
jgi:probable F420-dependent oxidoreductase